jgi:3',5'-cyclic AMP phosphodiesterase CpdA
MLDSNIMGAANEKDIEWLRNDLSSEAASQAAWRVVVMHHPMWPVVDNPKDTQRAKTMRESFLPLMEAYGVDLILCGHQHIYARNLPMSGETAVTPAAGGVGAGFSGADDGGGDGGGRGIVQIMAASGGKESYSAGILEHVATHADAPNYILLTADSEKLTVTAYSFDNDVIDTYEIFSIY